MKIGLCAIVKNEESIITRCLDSAKSLIDYVSIVDTGSSDNTVKVIEQWLIENKIEGKVFSEEWINFGANRTSALKKIREKKEVDYALMIDADESLSYDKDKVDIIKNQIILDCHSIVTVMPPIKYARPHITKNNMDFYYEGAVHEFVRCNEPIKNQCTITDIEIKLGAGGARSKNKNKYEDDAIAIEKEMAITTDKGLITRYTFYLAQSYRDCGKHDKALYHYNARASLGGWSEEIYMSLFEAAKIKEILKYPSEDIIQTYLKASEYCPNRIEALHGAAKACRLSDKSNQAYIIGKHARSLHKKLNGLFVQEWIWDWGMDDEFSLACYWTNRFEEGYEVIRRLVHTAPKDQLDRLTKGIKFFESKIKG
jgi:glycosyltransferase involved in cell wall biosynthesis